MCSEPLFLRMFEPLVLRVMNTSGMEEVGEMHP